MDERLLSGSVMALLLGSLATGAVDGILPAIPGMMSIGAAAIAMYDYGRRGGAAEAPNRSAIAIGSAVVTSTAVAALALAAIGLATKPAYARFGVAALALVFAIVGAGVRAGLITKAQAAVTRNGNVELAAVIGAALCAGAAGFISDMSIRSVLLAAPAALVTVGYLVRPIATAPATTS